MKTCFQSWTLFYVCKISPWQGQGWTESIPTESHINNSSEYSFQLEFFLFGCNPSRNTKQLYGRKCPYL